MNSVGAGPEAEIVAKRRKRLGASGTAARRQSPHPPKLIEAPIAEKALVPWRDVIAPHPDVQSRRFVNAEFAADLYQVWRGWASEEYQNPEQFFARTYLTSGLRSLVDNAARRLVETGRNPIVELQTSFGGGKTHALLALYHLVSGAPSALFLASRTCFPQSELKRCLSQIGR